MSFSEKSYTSEFLIYSWQRSKQFGVDPSRAETILLSQGELNDRKDRLHDLLHSSSPILEHLYIQLKHSPFMVIVADWDGYIVSTWGEPPFTDRAKRVWLNDGASWHENVKGTNAIGTALIEKKAVSVVGKEHYCKENRFLTCYAAPLYSSTGELLGILDVSGDARMHHPHTLGMIVSAAQACQSRLLLQNTERELVFTLREMDALTNHFHQPLISVNSEGLVTKVNLEAAKILKQPPETCIGLPLTQWFEEKDADKVLSLNESSFIPMKMKTHSNSKTAASWMVQPLKDDRQKRFRTILTLQNRDYTNKADVRPSSDFITSCSKIQQLLKYTYRVASTDVTMLIRGETGTGKEMIAREIHKFSKRKGPLITINCGAIPDHLIQSELFGYEKGAFTGARNEGYKGKFVAADGGTLFLDEIGELSLASQVALLRVLEDKQVIPLGSNTPRSVNVRVIAATNRDLAKEVTDKRFRADLYYRLREVEILLPPLRERTDLPEMAAHFLWQVAGELGIDTPDWDTDVKKRLEDYHWPGNIRELRQVIRQAVYHAFFIRHSTVLSVCDLPSRGFSDQEDNFVGLTNKIDRNDSFSLESRENETIAQAIRESEGNLSEAARLLQIGRTTLYRKLQQYPQLKEIRDKVLQQ